MEHSVRATLLTTLWVLQRLGLAELEPLAMALVLPPAQLEDTGQLSVFQQTTGARVQF